MTALKGNAIYKLIALILAAGGLAGLLWTARGPLKDLPAPVEKSEPEVQPSRIANAATLHPAAAPLATLLDQPQSSVEAEIQGVQEVLALYRRAFGENPIGQNDDIVDALLGNNPKHIAFLRGDIARIRDGKLLDRWKAPYWFHAESGTEFEIRSSGPDRELFTDDDITVK